MRHRALSTLQRQHLVDLLRAASEGATVVELSSALGLHPNTVRDHLRQLVEAGLARHEVAPPAGRGRPPHLYHATGDAETDADAPAFRSLAAALAEQLADLPDARRAAAEAGVRWGRSLATDSPVARTHREATARLIGILDQAGFAPEAIAGDAAEIKLRRCPFGALAVEHQRVVCGVHLGLMRGALQQMEAPVDAVRLEPFVRHDLCVAHLAPAVGNG